MSSAPTPTDAASPPPQPPGPLPTAVDAPGEQRLRRFALRASIVKDVIQAFAITAAGVWAVTTFWYREQYLPQRTDANVFVTGKLERLGEKDGVVTLRLSARVENTGRAVARLLGYTVTGYGQRVRTSGSDAGGRAPALDKPLEAGDWVAVAPSLQPERVVLTSRGSVLEPFNGRDNTTVRPDGSVALEEVFLVPRGELALFEAHLDVGWLPLSYPARADCYALRRDAQGAVRLGQTPQPGTGCRLSTASLVQTVSLWDGTAGSGGGAVGAAR